MAVHSHTAEATKRALRAGVDTIEHGTELDEECLALFLETGAFMVPTISIRSERARAGRAAGRAPADVVRKYEHVAAVGDQWFRRAAEAGVRMALGTDTYRSLRDYWGQNAYELELMVERGLSPEQALLTATRNAAEALGAGDRLGTLEPGKLADLLLVEGEPDRDVRVLQDPCAHPRRDAGGTDRRRPPPVGSARATPASSQSSPADGCLTWSPAPW